MNQERNTGRAGCSRDEKLILGLVILPNPGCRALAIATLAGCRNIELGPIENHRVPAVAETYFGKDKAMLDDICALPGVMHVDVVFAQTIAEE